MRRQGLKTPMRLERMKGGTKTSFGALSSEFARFVRFLFGELKPKGKIFTPFNVITGVIILVGLAIIVVRFAKGLGTVTNLSQEFPWGLWIGFDVVTGVAFAGGAYVLTFMVYILGLEKYHPIARITVLNGFLAYVFYAGALLLDIGRPWHIFNPIIGNSFGAASVMFLVAWHFFLYTMAELVEFSPAIGEWLGYRRVTRFLQSLTLGAVIFGIMLSTGHQSGLGALFLMAKGKLHPLWYSSLLPVSFFVSSIFAGLSMVILEGTISERVFADRIPRSHKASHGEIVVGLSRVCAGAMFVYLFLEVVKLINEGTFGYLATPMGAWYLLEVFGLMLVPAALFLLGARRANLFMLKIAAFGTVLGVALNRLNVSIIAYKWNAPFHYVPSWMEIWVTLAVISAEIWALRWIVRRMPVYEEHEEQEDFEELPLKGGEQWKAM